MLLSMKVLFLTPFYFDLHKPIFNEFKKQGHDVFVVEDILFSWDYRLVDLEVYKKIVFRFLDRLLGRRKRYWINKIGQDNAYQQDFDMFLCINGTSFHPFLLEYLKKRNPQIRSVLYLWDSLLFYDYLVYGRCFDRIFTFDPYDAKTFSGLKLLPTYWFPTKRSEIKYDLSIVGSDHDDRLSIVGSLYKQAEVLGLKTRLVVVLAKPMEHTGWIKYLRYFKKDYKKRCDEYEEKKKLGYTTTKPLPLGETMKLYDESRCILDTDRPIQSGATQRVIWSLVRGKKIVSTNSSLKEMPFYNEKQIKIIDRDNPVLDVDFIKDDFMFEVDDYFLNLRIDNWIKVLLDS